MNLEKSIASQCNPRALARGRAIAASDRNILTKQVRYDADESIISAFVASSSGWDDRYRTSVTLDEDAGDVVDYSCTCPAFREYNGMCKHCVALALTFSERPDTFMGYQAHRTAQSSACIAEFMKRTEALDVEDTPAGSVSLRAELSFGYGLWSAAFRISGPAGTPYVVKSLSEFAERMRRSEAYAYGKKLSFTHAPALFDDRSRAVAQFIERACSMREAADDGPAWLRRQTAQVGRTLQLSEAEAVELFDLLEGDVFSIHGADFATPTVERVHVVREDPAISLGLARAEHGWTIERGERIRIAEQAGRLYVWLGDDVVHRCSAAFARCADFLRTVYDSDENTLFIADGDMPLFCAAALPAYRVATAGQRAGRDKRLSPRSLQVGVLLRQIGEARAHRCAGRVRPAPLRAARAGAEGGRRRQTPRDRRRCATNALSAKASALIERFFEPRERIHRAVRGRRRDPPGVHGAFRVPRAGQRVHHAGVRQAYQRREAAVEPGRVAVGQPYQPDGGCRRLGACRACRPCWPATARRSATTACAAARSWTSRTSTCRSLTGWRPIWASRRKNLQRGVVELPSFRAFYLDEERNLHRDRSFTQYLENFHRVNETNYSVPEGLTATLRPYQVEGFRWLSARVDAGFGGILADEMGLGKSVQLISLLVARAQEARSVGPSLIVCPSSLVYNWLAEFERFAPGLSVVAVVGNAAERKVIRGRAFSAYDAQLAAAAGTADSGSASHAGDQLSPVDVLVTSYDLARIDSPDYAGREFYLCALDEAQYIKNPATLTTRAIKRLGARHRFALTGTPMENRLSELWSIFDFLMPGLLGPYARFRERFELPIVGGDEDVAARLTAATGPFILRRQKADVLTDLPDKLESVVYAPLEGQQLKLYRAHEQHLREELMRQRRERKERQAKRAAGEQVSNVEVLAELMRLRQLCCDPRLVFENYRGHGAKLDAIMELVSSARDGGEKTLLFSQFTSFLELIAQRLDEADIAYYTITGSTPKKDRVDMVNEFNGNDVPVFLVSLKAGGTGLNLTGASVVIHADPWWNAAAQQQATDRAHRIGQTRVVSVQKVIAKGTIEERILHLQEEKSKLADQVIGAAGMSLASLSTNELIDLLGE